MKKWLFLLMIISIFGISAYRVIFLKQDNKNPPNTQATNLASKETSTSSKAQEKEKFIFVPYWGLNGEVERENETLIYFGIAADENGIDRNDAGYRNLSSFKKGSTGSNKLLAVGMLDFKLNSKVLEDKGLQEKIIKDSVAIARENSFEGLVFDFELSALSFQSVIDKISSFNEDFYNAAKKEGLSYSVAIYGDTYYRGRPFDMKSISKNADKIVIMSYDFHKSKGSPGPNFPLGEKAVYGYDFAEMIADFTSDTEFSKLVISFGLFGYDWTIPEEGEQQVQARALSLSQIKNKFVGKCSSNCSLQRDKISAETQIKYKDEEGNAHIVWFEDEESMNKKIEYLKGLGINQTAIWAYSYY